MSGQHTLVVAKPVERERGLNQPWRGWVAAAEVVVAAAAVVVGILCWHHGFSQITTPVPGRAPLVSSVLYGNWAAGAIGLVVLAGMLVLDAARQTLLAVRTRQRPAPELPPDDDDLDTSTDTTE